MRNARLAAFLAGACALAQSAFAHHAFSDEYDVNRPIAIRGTLTRIEWVNPHG
jgi:hypothetical protein